MLNGARVLVVEDEPLIALELAQIIEEAGGVVTASERTLAQALRLAKNLHFDVALLDVRVRDGTTFEVAAVLSEKNIPFLFCTGDSEHREEFKNWPGVLVITKPHRPELVIEKLTKLLTELR